MPALLVVLASVVAVLGLGVCAAWNVLSQTRRVHPQTPGAGGDGGGGLGPVDPPMGGGRPSLSGEPGWTLQDDVDVHLLLQRASLR